MREKLRDLGIRFLYSIIAFILFFSLFLIFVRMLVELGGFPEYKHKPFIEYFAHFFTGESAIRCLMVLVGAFLPLVELMPALRGLVLATLSIAAIVVFFWKMMPNFAGLSMLPRYLQHVVNCLFIMVFIPLAAMITRPDGVIIICFFRYCITRLDLSKYYDIGLQSIFIYCVAVFWTKGKEAPIFSGYYQFFLVGLAVSMFLDLRAFRKNRQKRHSRQKKKNKRTVA